MGVVQIIPERVKLGIEERQEGLRNSLRNEGARRNFRGRLLLVPRNQRVRRKGVSPLIFHDQARWAAGAKLLWAKKCVAASFVWWWIVARLMKPAHDGASRLTLASSTNTSRS